ncbi:MAG: hypothetical protein Q4C70_04530 [Planctomycetia bacterium]|nr:hypothetical protein [Planctomycetia bacterium]
MFYAFLLGRELLISGKMNAEQLTKFAAELDTLPPRVTLKEAMYEMMFNRCVYLVSEISSRNSRNSDKFTIFGILDESAFRKAFSEEIWPYWELGQETDAHKFFEKDLQLKSPLMNETCGACLLSRHHRPFYLSDLTASGRGRNDGKFLVQDLIPPVKGIMYHLRQNELQLRLLRIATEIIHFELKNDRYPKTLEELPLSPELYQEQFPATGTFHYSAQPESGKDIPFQLRSYFMSF